VTYAGVDFLDQNVRELLPRTLGEWLAKYVRRRWPQNTAKRVEAAWDVDPTTARNLTRGCASERTITKALKAEGWPLLMALGEAVTGQSYADHLQELADEYRRTAERAATRQDNIRRLEAIAERLSQVPDWQKSRGQG